MGYIKAESSSPAKAAIWYTISSIVQKGIGMFFIPVYVHLMSTEEYGTYTLFQSWEGIVMIFTTLNLAAYVFNNCIARSEYDREKITGIFLGLIYILTVLSCIIFVFFLREFEILFGLSGKYIIAMVFDSAFFVCIDLWYAMKRFDYKYHGVVIITFLISITNMSAGIIAVYYSEEKAFAAIIIKLVIQGIIAVSLSASVFVKGRKIFSFSIWKYALCFNIPLIPHFLSSKILQQADRIMIEKFCGISQAGIYGFSYKISEAMIIFNSALLASLIPWTYKKLKEKKFAEIQDKVFITIFFVGSLNILFILLAPEVVAILGTEEYKEAIYIIPPVACSCFLMYLFNVFVNVTYFYEHNKLVVLASIIAAIVNVVLNYVFIPSYGYLSAGYTTLISYICLAVVHGVIYKYTLKLEGINTQVYNLRKILIFSISIIMTGILSSFLYQYYFARYVIVVLLFVILFIKKDKIFHSINL